jgi:uncharacterized protein YlzI (FlbEa/FlbD family)
MYYIEFLCRISDVDEEKKKQYEAMAMDLPDETFSFKRRKRPVNSIYGIDEISKYLTKITMWDGEEFTVKGKYDDVDKKVMDARREMEEGRRKEYEEEFEEDAEEDLEL